MKTITISGTQNIKLHYWKRALNSLAELEFFTFDLTLMPQNSEYADI